MTDISNTNEIQSYLHCTLCINESKVSGIRLSPSDYQNIEVGWTPKGLQVWCKRHDCNMLHIDFEGQVHPANTTRARNKDKDPVLRVIKQSPSS